MSPIPLSPLLSQPPSSHRIPRLACPTSEGYTVVAAARDAARTTATLKTLLGDVADMSKLFVKGGVDVTDASTLTSDLFEGVTKVVSATGAIFGADATGKMGYLDNMTSERVDKMGNENIAAAAKKYLKIATLPEKKVVDFSDKEELAKWRRMCATLCHHSPPCRVCASPSFFSFLFPLPSSHQGRRHHGRAERQRLVCL